MKRHALRIAIALALPAMAMAAPPAPPSPPPAPPVPAQAPAAPLSEAEQARLQREMEALQREMQALGRRMGELGARMGRNQQRIVMQRLGGERIGLGVVLGESTEGGARIAAVTPGSPAEKAGLKAGDVIQRVHGRTVSSPPELTEALRGIQKGQAVNVGYRRDGRALSAVVVADQIGDAASFRWMSNIQFDPDGPLGMLAGPGRTMVIEDIRRITSDAVTVTPDGNTFFFSGDTGVETADGGRHIQILSCAPGNEHCDGSVMQRAFRFSGLNLSPVDAQLGRYFGTDTGVLVISRSDVLQGLQSGDVLLSLDGRPTTQPAEVMRLLRDKDSGSQVTATVMRDRAKREVRITIPEGRPIDFLPPPPPAPPAPPPPPAPPRPAGLPI